MPIASTRSLGVQLLDLPDELLLSIFNRLAPDELTAKSARAHLQYGLNHRLLGVVRESLFSSASLRLQMTLSDFLGFSGLVVGFEQFNVGISEASDCWTAVHDSPLGRRIRHVKLRTNVSRKASDNIMPYTLDALKGFSRLGWLEVNIHSTDGSPECVPEILQHLIRGAQLALPHIMKSRITYVQNDLDTV